MFPLHFFNFAVMFAVNLCLPVRHQGKAGHAGREGKTVSSRGNKPVPFLERDSLAVCEQSRHSAWGDTSQDLPIV